MQVFASFLNEQSAVQDTLFRLHQASSIHTVIAENTDLLASLYLSTLLWNRFKG